jgi:hypothetical protein
MQDFVRNENIKLYRRSLLASSDDDQRRVVLVLLSLLVDEQSGPPATTALPETLLTAWCEPNTVERPPSRECKLCGCKMNYLAELPPTPGKSAGCIFRCFSCNSVISVSKPHCLCAAECLAQTCCTTRESVVSA